MSDTAAPLLSTLDEAFQADPHRVLADARRFGWHVPTPFGRVVLSYRRVHALTRDSRLLSYGTFPIEVQGVFDGPLHEWWQRAPLHIDGDDHARIRRLVARAFTPRSVDALRPRIRAIASELLETVEDAETVEFMEAFADPLPVRVICELLGVPDEDVELFSEWARGLGMAFGFDLASHRERIEASVVGLYGYVEELLAQRRRQPGDDLVSRLLEVEEEGERLDRDELLALVVALLFAGHDTTRNQFGCAMATFADHSEEWQRLQDDPGLVASAVEEVLRYEPAVAGTARLAGEPFEYDGLEVGEGNLIELSSLAANRDPDVFADPHRFDIGRKGEPPVTFGGGVHHCLGAALARAELQEALPLLAKRWPEFDVERPLTWRPFSAIRGPERLVVGTP